MVHKLSTSFLSILYIPICPPMEMDYLENSETKMLQVSSGHVQTTHIDRFVTTLAKISWISIKKEQKINPCHMAPTTHQHRAEVTGMDHWDSWKEKTP